MSDFNQSELEGIEDQAAAAVLRRILASQRALISRFDAFEQRFSGAFPGGDSEGHKRAHEAMIADIQARRDLAKAVKEKTISGLIWAGIVALGAAVWQYIKGLLR